MSFLYPAPSINSMCDFMTYMNTLTGGATTGLFWNIVLVGVFLFFLIILYRFNSSSSSLTWSSLITFLFGAGLYTACTTPLINETLLVGIVILGGVSIILEVMKR